MLIAEVGRAKGFGERGRSDAMDGSGERLSDDWCCRIAKTNVLLRAKREH
jgi:hypothetical protein